MSMSIASWGFHDKRCKGSIWEVKLQLAEEEVGKWGGFSLWAREEFWPEEII